MKTQCPRCLSSSFSPVSGMVGCGFCFGTTERKQEVTVNRHFTVTLWDSAHSARVTPFPPMHKLRPKTLPGAWK